MHNFDPDHYGISATAMADVDWWIQQITAMSSRQPTELPVPDEPPRRASVATLLEREQQRLQIQGPADLIAAVPYLLGFHPDPGSLIIAEFAGMSLGCTLRTDLTASPETLAEVAGEMRSRGSDSAVTIAYSEHSSGPARDILEARGIRIIDRFRVHDGRWYSLDCQEPCCPPEGTPVLDQTATTTALISHGRQARPDRDAALALLEPVTADVRDEIGVLVDRMHAEQGPIRTQEAAAAAHRTIERLTTLEGMPDREHIAELAYSLESNVARNWAIMQILNRRVHQSTDLWIWVMRHLRADHAAPAAALAAYAAFQDGNGMIAEECLDIALRADPDHRLAIVLYYAICSGVTPNQVREFHGYYC